MYLTHLLIFVLSIIELLCNNPILSPLRDAHNDVYWCRFYYRCSLSFFSILYITGRQTHFNVFLNIHIYRSLFVWYNTTTPYVYCVIWLLHEMELILGKKKTLILKNNFEFFSKTVLRYNIERQRCTTYVCRAFLKMCNMFYNKIYQTISYKRTIGFLIFSN